MDNSQSSTPRRPSSAPPKRDTNAFQWQSPGNQTPSSPNNLFTALQGAVELWRANLVDHGNVNSTSEQQAKVQENRSQAEQLIHGFGGQPPNVPVNSQQHMGLPTTLSGWADLGVEAALLPKPGLHHPLNQATQQQRQPQTIQQPSQPPQNPFPLFTLLQNLQAQHPQPPSQQLPQQQHVSRHAEFIAALANEPNQHWLKINWVETPAKARGLAFRTKKPLFIELVVGRLADKNSNVC
eukprot:TRINITY_DN8303_c0_g1_i2.p1 TRINITY_DN8303_c0_g1~~TRINITY_DN8303_c0_g1_i2.p1  ORF type:complete len:238 (+),score=57.40 TRINITY_DN8303_c0_g1_i2:79-792(+)